MAEPTPAATQLPQALGWYRESANWLVGLSVGALAAAANCADKLLKANAFLKVVFMLSGGGFLIAVVGGVAFYYWLLRLGNALESRRPDDAKIISDAPQRYTTFYNLMISGFLFGIISLAVLASASLYYLPKKHAICECAVNALDFSKRRDRGRPKDQCLDFLPPIGAWPCREELDKLREKSIQDSRSQEGRLSGEVSMRAAYTVAQVMTDYLEWYRDHRKTYDTTRVVIQAAKLCELLCSHPTGLAQVLVRQDETISHSLRL
jgi:hypothetical protein